MCDNEEHRISLITFKETTVHIRTWWITEDKYALIDAALGEPAVDSMYPREFIDAAQDDVLEQGVHMWPEQGEDDDDDA